MRNIHPRPYSRYLLKPTADASRLWSMDSALSRLPWTTDKTLVRPHGMIHTWKGPRQCPRQITWMRWRSPVPRSGRIACATSKRQPLSGRGVTYHRFGRHHTGPFLLPPRFRSSIQHDGGRRLVTRLLPSYGSYASIGTLAACRQPSSFFVCHLLMRLQPWTRNLGSTRSGQCVSYVTRNLLPCPDARQWPRP